MSAVIKIKNSSTASAVPTSSDLVQGELAVNVTDKRIFTENASGTVVELGTNPSILTLPDGSASAPTLTNDGDTNTGIFFPAADTIAFAEGGTETMRLDSAGNMGLGVTPSTWFSANKAIQFGSTGAVSNYTSGSNIQTFLSNNVFWNAAGTISYLTTNTATSYTQDNGTHKWYYAASGTAGNAITFTQAMTLDASGNLGIGTTSPAKKLDVSTGDIRLSSGYTVQWGGTANYIYGDSTSNFFVVATNGSERARIDSSGNLLVGLTSSQFGTAPRIETRVADGRAFGVSNSGTGTATAALFLNNVGGSVGSITFTTTATTYATSSDYRLKENIAPMTGALAKVAALKPVTYTWKSNGSEGEGFIAHELAEVCPHAVTGEKDATEIQQYEISPAVPATFDDEGNELTPAVEAVMGEREVPVYQGIDTSFLVATLTAAIQEQQALITSLTARIEALEA